MRTKTCPLRNWWRNCSLIENLSHNPLFQVMFVLQNAPRPELELSDLTLSFLRAESGIARFDLTLFMWEDANGLVGRLE